MNVIVEIDEAKVGKRKHEKGRTLEGQRIFGGVERDNPKNMFVVAVEKGDSETLLRVSKELILPSTILIAGELIAV